ncbi:MAG: IS200/IS605 family transposase [Phycisphaerales bacterium]
MPGTFTKLVYHLTFSTKHRLPHIAPDIRPRLYDYLGGSICGERGTLYAIGGTADHVHLLIRWRPDMSLSDLMRNVKGGSSTWVHQTLGLREFAWQEGYGAFTVSQSGIEDVKAYIARQEEHHRVKTFKEEYIEFLDRHEIEYDLKYVFD